MKHVVAASSILCLIVVAGCPAPAITKPDLSKTPCGSYGVVCNEQDRTCCPEHFLCGGPPASPYFNPGCDEVGTCCPDENYRPGPDINGNFYDAKRVSKIKMIRY